VVVVALLAFASPSYAEDTATEVATEAADSAAEEMAEVSEVASEQVASEQVAEAMDGAAEAAVVDASEAAAATAAGLEAGVAALDNEAVSEAADEATEAIDAAEDVMVEASDAEAGGVVAEEAVEDAEDDYADAYPDEYAIVEFTNEDYVLADSWVPSIVFSVVVHEEDTEIEVDSRPLEFSFDRKEIRTLASLRFGGELMTPTFDKVPIKPRFFVSAGVLWSTPGNGLSHSNHDTTSVSDYRAINLDSKIRSFNLTPDDRPLKEFEGRGTSVEGRQLHNSWYAGVGGVLTFPRSGFTIRVRPSIEYIGEEFRINGEYTLLSENDPPDNPRMLMIHEIDISDKNIHHNIGPGLELEFVNHLDGDFTLSFFTQTRFMWIIGDTEMNLKGTDSQGEDAAFRFKRSRFNFRGGMGFRLGFRNTAFKF
jgi:hypothetical protein